MIEILDSVDFFVMLYRSILVHKKLVNSCLDISTEKEKLMQS